MKLSQHGSFDNNIENIARDNLLEEFDFAACQRPDGSIYGIAAGKKCRKGSEVKPSQRIDKAFLRRSPAKLKAYLRSRKLYPYQRKAIEAELKKRGIEDTAAIRELAQKPGSVGVRGKKALGEKLKQKAAEKRRAVEKKPSMQVNKRFLQRETTQKLQEYLNNRKLYKYQREKIKAELKRRGKGGSGSAPKKPARTDELINKAIQPGTPGREARLELAAHIREREAKRFEGRMKRAKDPKVKALLLGIDDQLASVEKRRKKTIYQKPENKKLLDSLELKLLRKRDQVLSGKIKPPSQIKKPYGLDSDVGVIVNKKLLGQDTLILQQILKNRSLNPNQRAKIAEEVAGRGETPASAKKPQRRAAAKDMAGGAGWNVTEGVKGYKPIQAYNRKDNVLLGQGAMGKAFRTKGPPPGVVKQGAIGEEEVKAWQTLQKTGRVPEFYGAVVSKNMKELDSGFGGHVREAKGYLGLGEARGKTLYNQTFDNDQKRDLINEYIRARRDIHKAGVAHNDMHAGNVYYDQATKKVQLIDFGLAQVSPKAALMEALGTNQGDWQSGYVFNAFMSRGDEPSLYNRFRRNQQKVLKALGNEGYETGNILVAGIRNKVEYIDQLFNDKLTDDRARQLIDQLYEGV